MILLGRTLSAPRTVELMAMALTGRVPTPNPEEAGWWYPKAERRLRLASDGTAPLTMEAHTDPIAEAVRWRICEVHWSRQWGEAAASTGPPTRRWRSAC